MINANMNKKQRLPLWNCMHLFCLKHV